MSSFGFFRLCIRENKYIADELIIWIYNGISKIKTPPILSKQKVICLALLELELAITKHRRSSNLDYQSSHIFESNISNPPKNL